MAWGEWVKENSFSLTSVAAGLITRRPEYLVPGLVYLGGGTLFPRGGDEPWEEWEPWEERPRVQGFDPSTWGRNSEVGGVYGMGSR